VCVNAWGEGILKSREFTKNHPTLEDV